MIARSRVALFAAVCSREIRRCSEQGQDVKVVPLCPVVFLAVAGAPPDV